MTENVKALHKAANKLAEKQI